MRRASTRVAVLAAATLTHNWRYTSSSSSSSSSGKSGGDGGGGVAAQVRVLSTQVQHLEEKLRTLEASKAANALVALYATHRLNDFDVRKLLLIFSDPGVSSPVYCHRQLPVILSHFIGALDTMPAGLHAMPSILAVREVLLQSFKRLVECAIPVHAAQIRAFVDALDAIEETHTARDLLTTMARGILELKEHLSQHKSALHAMKRQPQWSQLQIGDGDGGGSADGCLPAEEMRVIQEPMNFCNNCLVIFNYLSRMLRCVYDDEYSCTTAATHAASTPDPPQQTAKKTIGLVDLEVNLERVVRLAIDDASHLCCSTYGDCPETKIVIASDAKRLRFPFMRNTIQYVVVELLKNAYRATIEAHMKRNDMGIVTCDDMPPICVLIHLQADAQHACICVMDEGGGMTLEQLDMAMAYSYTTVPRPALRHDDHTHHGNGDTAHSTSAPTLAGYGYGLPMSRVYARAFGGDLQLHTMEGLGTRAYYYIKLS